MAETQRQANTTNGELPQPSQVIVPGDSATPNPVVPPVAVDRLPPSLLATTPEPVSPYAQEQPALTDGDFTVSWTASEFIAHEKDFSWYGALAGGALVLSVLIYLFTKDIISGAVIIVCALAFGFYGSRQPRQLTYIAINDAIKIGEKIHHYNDFRSFSVVPEGVFSSIQFMPLKRFSPVLTIYYPPEVEDQLIGLLAAQLPNEPARHDPVDRLMRHIRF